MPYLPICQFSGQIPGEPSANTVIVAVTVYLFTNQSCSDGESLVWFLTGCIPFLLCNQQHQHYKTLPTHVVSAA